MNLTKCDNHPDRDAVVTLYVYPMSRVGARPVLVGFSMSGSFHDLCEECAESLKIKHLDEESA